MEFELGDFIQKGTYGRIYKDKVRKDVVIKVIRKTKLNESKIDPYLEINILSMINSKYIIKMFDWVESDKNIFHILEYVDGGDLFERIKKERFTEDLALKYIKKISKGIDYIHKQQIIHRDLKPENILLTRDGKIKIIDFGFAVFFEKNSKFEQIIGTVFYIAPEAIEGNGYDCRIDIWALGAIYYEMLVGCPCFDGESAGEVLSKISLCQIEFPAKLSANTVSNVRRILMPVPEYRATIDEILKM